MDSINQTRGRKNIQQYAAHAKRLLSPLARKKSQDIIKTLPKDLKEYAEKCDEIIQNGITTAKHDADIVKSDGGSQAQRHAYNAIKKAKQTARIKKETLNNAVEQFQKDNNKKKFKNTLQGIGLPVFEPSNNAVSKKKKKKVSFADSLEIKNYKLTQDERKEKQDINRQVKSNIKKNAQEWEQEKAEGQ